MEHYGTLGPFLEHYMEHYGTLVMAPITCHIMCSACVTCVYVPKRVIVRHTAKQQLVSFIHVVLWGAHNVLS